MFSKAAKKISHAVNSRGKKMSTIRYGTIAGPERISGTVHELREEDEGEK